MSHAASALFLTGELIPELEIFRTIQSDVNLKSGINPEPAHVMVITLAFQAGRPGFNPWSDLYSRS